MCTCHNNSEIMYWESILGSEIQSSTPARSPDHIHALYHFQKEVIIPLSIHFITFICLFVRSSVLAVRFIPVYGVISHFRCGWPCYCPGRKYGPLPLTDRSANRRRPLARMIRSDWMLR